MHHSKQSCFMFPSQIQQYRIHNQLGFDKLNLYIEQYIVTFFLFVVSEVSTGRRFPSLAFFMQ